MYEVTCPFDKQVPHFILYVEWKEVAKYLAIKLNSNEAKKFGILKFLPRRYTRRGRPTVKYLRKDRHKTMTPVTMRTTMFPLQPRNADVRHHHLHHVDIPVPPGQTVHLLLPVLLQSVP